MFNYKIKMLLALLVYALVDTACSATVDNVFLGRWCWDLNNNVRDFDITIKIASNSYVGSYDSVVGGGRIIDDNENAFSFKATKNKIIKTKIKAGISGNIGLIQLKILSNKKIEWLVLQKPKGQFYVPTKAILNKC